jgi:hypothetical protein
MKKFCYQSKNPNVDWRTVLYLANDKMDIRHLHKPGATVKHVSTELILHPGLDVMEDAEFIHRFESSAE